MNQQQNNEAERYHTEEVCIYCGKPRPGNFYAACCGEMHYATQKEIDEAEVKNV
jgi:hypothetical protein